MQVRCRSTQDIYKYVGAAPPYFLRNARIQDRSTLTILSLTPSLPVNFQGTFPLAIFNDTKGPIEITEEMKYGPRPSKYAKSNSFHKRYNVKEGTAANGKKLLVHGYCSDAKAWPTEDFTDYVVFSDPNQSRDLDTFAGLIKQLGENENLASYSIIAHSQVCIVSL